MGHLARGMGKSMDACQVMARLGPRDNQTLNPQNSDETLGNTEVGQRSCRSDVISTEL